MKYERILQAIAEECWMIQRAKMDQIIAVIEARANGVTLEGDYFAKIEARRKANLGAQGKVHVLGLYGTISQRPSVFSSGGTSTEEFGRELATALNDPQVGAVLIDADSPGGSVFGVHELSQQIFQSRGRKPILAVANAEAYSAGYYIASAADELWVTPTGMVGSIGVLAVHLDYSKMNEKIGVEPTYITAGKYKAEGNPDEPLGKEARAELQKIVDRYYGMFVESVARNRKVDAATVERDFGQGRVFSGPEAVQRGMADRVGTFAEALAAAQERAASSRGTTLERRKLGLARAKS